MRRPSPGGGAASHQGLSEMSATVSSHGEQNDAAVVEPSCGTYTVGEAKETLDSYARTVDIGGELAGGVPLALAGGMALDEMDVLLTSASGPAVPLVQSDCCGDAEVCVD